MSGVWVKLNPCNMHKFSLNWSLEDIPSSSLLTVVLYSKTCLKWPLSRRPQIGFQDQLSLNAGQKYCRMLQGEHSAILSTFIKLSFVIRIFILSIFEWRLYTVLLSLSFWCLVMVVWLFLVVPWVCLRFVIVVFPDHTQLLFLPYGIFYVWG